MLSSEVQNEKFIPDYWFSISDLLLFKGRTDIGKIATPKRAERTSSKSRSYRGSRKIRVSKGFSSKTISFKGRGGL